MICTKMDCSGTDLPFIDLIKDRMEVLQLTDGLDYRLDRLKEMEAYILSM